MERFNIAMQEIQNDGSMAQWLELRGKEVKAREWAKLVDIVHDQAYSRIVGPYSNELEVSSCLST
jgi:H3 lysine-79-specific histone-lysine N-methyltransferase